MHPWITRTAAMFLLVFAAARPCSGASFGADSRSYLLSREGSDASRYLTFYEYLDADLGGSPGFSFHAGGWGKLDLREESAPDEGDGDLQYAYLGYLDRRANTSLSLGRVVVSEGVAAAERLDGLSFRSDVGGGVDFAAWVGLPLETSEGGRKGDLIYGGRTSLGGTFYRLGFSYLREKDDGTAVREEEGLDWRLNPGGTLGLAGKASYNALQNEWMENDVRLTIGLSESLSLEGQYRLADYGSFFQAPANAAFLEPDLDIDERLRLLGFRLYMALGGGHALHGEYRRYGFDIAGNATAWGAGATLDLPDYAAGFFYRRVDGDTDELRYSEYWIYTSFKSGRNDLRLEFVEDVYDTAVSGAKTSWSAVASLGYDAGDSLRLALDGEYAVGPWYDKDVKAFLKVLYRFSAAGKGGGRE